MVARPDGRFTTQRDHPRLALVGVSLRPDGSLVLEAPDMAPLAVPVPGPGRPTVPVQVWGSSFEAVPADEAAHEWFTRYIGADLRLIHLDDPLRRPVDPDFALPGETVTFADGYPLLLTTTSSLTALNDLITEEHQEPSALPMDRFRPNVVIDGTEAWAEDGWKRVRIGEVDFRVAKPCGRCVVTTIDQKTALRGGEPLRTLGRHRRFGKDLVFGQNLVPQGTGTLRLGDGLTVLE
ncbi:molybdenum cofactor biosysynthesis protein [Wenjunlia tyrosinilytica]|uniref:Molybdenum cofactor biosysynthesis protein n=2 Tax=Wenjunlia tyrosinilytica TaxID=1544741 RepID=A0A918DZR5_9ACTN|nr:molybdenum cofactor biosysynthesis protein [Wenjunlia tyrosinilytica]